MRERGGYREDVFFHFNIWEALADEGIFAETRKELRVQAPWYLRGASPVC